MFDFVMKTFNEFINIFGVWSTPSQRLYWPFLLSSLVILIIWSKKNDRSFIKELLSPSSLLDLKLFTLNGALKVFLFPFFIFTSFEVSVFFLRLLRNVFPFFEGLELSPSIAAFLATLLAFVINDFFRFIHHYLMHRLPLLRTLHRTHHSALVLTPLTLFRSHPLEAFIASIRNVLAVGITLALYSFLYQRPLAAWDILGVNLFGFLFNAFMANLRHSPVPIGFGIFEYLFISPRMHQIHHSDNPNHFGKNYGVALALWDQIAGSFYRPSSEEMMVIKYGIGGEGQKTQRLEEATTLIGALGLKSFSRLVPQPLRLKTVVK